MKKKWVHPDAIMYTYAIVSYFVFMFMPLTAHHFRINTYVLMAFVFFYHTIFWGGFTIYFLYYCKNNDFWEKENKR